MEASINQFQEMKKELAEAWSAVASAESRAAVAEVFFKLNMEVTHLNIYILNILSELSLYLLGSMF